MMLMIALQSANACRFQKKSHTKKLRDVKDDLLFGVFLLQSNRQISLL